MVEWLDCLIWNTESVGPIGLSKKTDRKEEITTNFEVLELARITPRHHKILQGLHQGIIRYFIEKVFTALACINVELYGGMQANVNGR